MKILTSKVVPLVLISTLLLFTLSSCGDDGDFDEQLEELGFVELPSSVVTTYSGYLSFEDSSETEVEALSGSATIRKKGSTYTIDFSDGVPSITNRKFNEVNGGYISADTAQSSDGIVIDGKRLVVQMTIDGKDWEFAGDR